VGSGLGSASAQRDGLRAPGQHAGRSPGLRLQVRAAGPLERGMRARRSAVARLVPGADVWGSSGAQLVFGLEWEPLQKKA
jgi:hypothetical protein